MTVRRDYLINITVNSRRIHRVVIDGHYELKHRDSIHDQIILQLVQLLDGLTFVPDGERDGFQYFKTEPLWIDRKSYRLIWLLECQETYIGVVNAFRR